MARVKYSKTINSFMTRLFSYLNKESKAQNIVELTIIVAASMIALMAVFMIYSDQFGVLFNFDDYHVARASVRKIVDAANTVYYAGAGSEIKIFVEMPSSMLFEESGISGKTVYIKMADGSDILDVADVNIEGNWRNDSKYYMVLKYDGNNVKLQYLDFELNKYSIYFSTTPGTSVSESISIRNNYSEEVIFYITNNFSHSNVNLDLVETITIPSGATETIDLDFTISSSASGNYFGNIIITGEINDVNLSKTVSISVGVHQQQ